MCGCREGGQAEAEERPGASGERPGASGERPARSGEVRGGAEAHQAEAGQQD